MDLMTKYKDLQTKIVKRKENFDKFIDFLETETSWLTSPASTRYHLAIESGLLKHSVGVAETLLHFRESFAPEISEESCVIVGLFHDIGKVGYPGIPLYLKNDNAWEVRNRNINYKYNPEAKQMGLAARSLYLIAPHLLLSDAEAQAILYHDGQYIDENKIVAHKEEPLTLLVHWADYWTAHIFEEERKITSVEPVITNA